MTTHNKPKNSQKSETKTIQPTPEHLKPQIQEPESATEIPAELNASVQRIDELKEKGRLPRKLSEGILILSATIFTYLVAFAYKFSCLSHYELPLDLMRVDTDDLMITGGITVFVLILPMILFVTDTFLASLLSKDTIIKYHKYREHLGISAILAFFIILSMINLGWKVTTLFTLFTLLLFLKLKKISVATRNLFKLNKTREKTKETARLIKGSEADIKRLEIFATYIQFNGLVNAGTGFLLTLTAFTLITTGKFYQEQKRTYAYIATDPPKLLLTRNGTSAIFADYDVKLGVIKKRWTIIDINNLPGPLSITNFFKPPEIEKDDNLHD